MKSQYREINFLNEKSDKFQFDIVSFQDILNKKPTDHSQFEFHKVSFFAILLFTDKVGKYNLNFTDFDYKRGTLFTIRKNNIHKFYKSDANGTLLVFTENFILNYTNRQEASNVFLLFNEMLTSPKLQLDKLCYDEIMNLINLIRTEYNGVYDVHSLRIIRSYTQVIITKLLRVKSNENIVFEYNKYLSMFLKFQNLVEEECFNVKKVAYYAKVIGVSTKTLNNVSQSIIHKSAKAFINEVVITQSKRLIINSSNSLTEIAYQSGFEDPTNFFKYFKKYTGVTPKQFRIKHQMN